MRIGIVGSRRRLDREAVVAFVDSLDQDDIVISGACRGVDLWAAEAARKRGLFVVEYRPDLVGCVTRSDYIRAYYARNTQIADASELLVAFVSSDRRGGTEHTINEANRLGVPVQLK